MTEKKLDWPDILFHCAHAGAAGILAGVMMALGVQEGGQFILVAMAAATATMSASMLFWVLREKSQHGGKLGGLQSKLEAYAPLIVCLVLFFLSTAVTWRFL
jgi:hypothetical protein